jgi:hypothetical protein
MLGGRTGERRGRQLFVGQHAGHVGYDQAGAACVADDVGVRVGAVFDRVGDLRGRAAEEVAESVAGAHLERHRQRVEVVADDLVDVRVVLGRRGDAELDGRRAGRLRQHRGGRGHRDGERRVARARQLGGRHVERFREVTVGFGRTRRGEGEAPAGVRRRARSIQNARDRSRFVRCQAP